MQEKTIDKIVTVACGFAILGIGIVLFETKMNIPIINGGVCIALGWFLMLIATVYTHVNRYKMSKATIKALKAIEEKMGKEVVDIELQKEVKEAVSPHNI